MSRTVYRKFETMDCAIQHYLEHKSDNVRSFLIGDDRYYVVRNNDLIGPTFVILALARPRSFWDKVFGR